MTWHTILPALQAAEDLSADQTRWAMGQILTGQTSDEDLATFLLALRAKGETAEEVSVLAEVMLEHAHRVDVPGVVLDVVGTGGDHAGTVNISTMAALVCAAAGAPVVKHGNRAASSQTGTADVLEALGVRIELDPTRVRSSVAQVGIGFCFAPMHHPAMRHALPVRRQLGVPTVFNLLGPLSNPAGARAALIGCASLVHAPVMAQVLANRGVCALVVRGDDGLDEMSISGRTAVWDTTSGAVVERFVDIVDVGLTARPHALLAGGDAALNAALLEQTLGLAPIGDLEKITAITDAVVLNAAGALVAYDAAVAGNPVQSDADFIERLGAAMIRTRAQLIDAGLLLRRWQQVTEGL